MFHIYFYNLRLGNKSFLTFSAPSSFEKVEESSEHQNRSLLFIRGEYKVGYLGGDYTPPLPQILISFIQRRQKVFAKVEESSEHQNPSLQFIRTI